jgi:opacity protein-like surface antigen
MGGGVSFAMGNRWSIDGDVRYVAIGGDRDLHIGRFGAGVTYRF